MEKLDFADARLGKVAKSENERSRYSWFVSYFLFSAEQIYTSFPDDPEWSAALSDQVCYHRAYLQGYEYQRTLKAHYAQPFYEFVEKSLSHCPN